MSKFRLRKDDDGDVIACDCCDCEVPTALFKDCHTDMPGQPFQDFNFCDVCASTYLSKAVTYPSQCDDALLYKSIARIANMILKAIKEKK